jgi:rhodanese-related sulfurtransferase
MRKVYFACLIGLSVFFLMTQGCSSTKQAGVANHTSVKTLSVKTQPAVTPPAKPAAEAVPETAQNCPPAKQAGGEKFMSEKLTVSKPNTVTSNSAVGKEQSAPAAVIDLSPDQLRSMIANKEDIVILDVRAPEELSTWPAALDKAVNIPLQELPARYSELPRDKNIVAVCRSGHRSAAAADFLLKAGFKKIYSLAGGMMAYRQSETK